MDSFQDLKDKYIFHSQKQIEREKKSTRTTKLIEIAQQSNVKLLALQKALKTKMDEKKRERYEKRLLMFKIANEEEEADYEKFFDENESECEFNDDEEQKKNEETDEENDDENNDKESEKNSQEINDENDSQESDDEKSSNDDSQESDDEKCSNEDDSQSMECTPSNLIESNRDLVTKMMLKSQQSQLDNEGLLDLCSAKVPNDFIDDECEENDDSMSDNRLDDEESENESNNESNDELSQDKLDEENELSEQEKIEDDKILDDVHSETLKEKTIKPRKFDSDSDDDDDLAFINQFKFKKTCKINESDDEEVNLKDKVQSMNHDLNAISSNDQTDVYENLNSQDSQFDNNRESTFLESRSDFEKPRFNLKEFIEDQAELSEEDKDKVSSDEEEDSNDEYEEDEIDEILPSNEEIVKANNKMFMKQQMDEDKREILEYQERFLECGDLHDDGEMRQRKFKWKNVDNVWIDNVQDSSDSDEFEIPDSQIEFTSLHLKQLSEMDKSKKLDNNEEPKSQSTQSSQLNLSKDEKRKKKLMNTSLNKSHLNSYSTFDNKIFDKHMRSFKRSMVNGPANDIQSYIIKDKNLVNAMSVKSSVVIANQNKAKHQLRNDFGGGVGQAKKRKIDKNENKKSIFDLF